MAEQTLWGHKEAGSLWNHSSLSLQSLTSPHPNLTLEPKASISDLIAEYPRQVRHIMDLSGVSGRRFKDQRDACSEAGETQQKQEVMYVICH